MKSPKQKAEELVDKYITAGCLFANAIECAKIAVDEIIDQWFMIDTYLGDWNRELNPNLRYWQEVKNELNNM